MSKYEDEYGYDLHFLETCAEMAVKKHRENDDNIYCEGFINGWNAHNESKNIEPKIANIIPWYDGNFYCSACKSIVDPVFDFCCHCGAELDLEYVL